MRGIGHKLMKNHMSAAVIGGHLDMIRWLHNEGCEFSDNICEKAAQYNRFYILVFLHGMIMGCVQVTNCMQMDI